jgi:hypothetical protein
MNPQLQQWLVSKPPLAGIYAWGIRMPDQTTCTQSFSEAFAVPAIENAWRCVADTLQVIHLSRFPDRRIRWVFEHGWLCCAVRLDGSFLGVFTTNQIDRADWTGLEGLLMEFQSLNLTNLSA